MKNFVAHFTRYVGLVKTLPSTTWFSMPFMGATCFKRNQELVKYQAAHYELVARSCDKDHPRNWPRKVGCMLAAGNTIPNTAHSRDYWQPLRKTKELLLHWCSSVNTQITQEAGSVREFQIQMTLGLVEESYCWFCFLFCASRVALGIQKWGIWPLEMFSFHQKILIWILWRVGRLTH